MKVLITGHEGFIGRNALRILSKNHTVIPFEGNICEWDMSKDYGGPDVVLHLAALAGVRKSWTDPEGYWKVNVTASKRIFEWAESRRLKTIYASSSSVYEWWKNPYATSKKAMEELAPKGSTGMRFHTVYGPDSRPDMFYDMMLNDKVEYKTDHYRDWTHVEDVCSAIEILLTNLNYSGIVDIGSNEPISVSDVLDAYGYRDIPFKDVVGERHITHANIDEMRRLGWSPKYNIMEEVKNERIKRTVPLG
jgi:nucleoside-diphosphate-sugar epimerase